MLLSHNTVLHLSGPLCSSNSYFCVIKVPARHFVRQCGAQNWQNFSHPWWLWLHSGRPGLDSQ